MVTEMSHKLSIFNFIIKLLQCFFTAFTYHTHITSILIFENFHMTSSHINQYYPCGSQLSKIFTLAPRELFPQRRWGIYLLSGEHSWSSQHFFFSWTFVRWLQEQRCMTRLQLFYWPLQQNTHHSADSFTASSLAAEFLFLLWAVYLCYAVRTVPSAFHEPRYMAIAVHNELILSAIFYVIRYWSYRVGSVNRFGR